MAPSCSDTLRGFQTQGEDPHCILTLFRWGHVAPTCPDTLGGFPTQGEDPHCILTLPDILIAGNQVLIGIFEPKVVILTLNLGFEYLTKNSIFF